jgi:hypothetical protein
MAAAKEKGLVRQEGKDCGFFTITEEAKITSFYLNRAYYPIAQPVFKAALEEYRVKTAYVLTCDELFLSLCLDFHQRIESGNPLFHADTEQFCPSDPRGTRWTALLLYSCIYSTII